MNKKIIEEKFKYISNYKEDEKLRTSFNGLTRKTYGFDFEIWYESGYWQEGYIPCSLVDGNKVIANVSVNLMDFEIDGIYKHYIQLGTVMTDDEYRNQGLSRYLMEKVIKQWENKVDGIYLFANDNVLNFYPKFGFAKSYEYQYSKSVIIDGNISAEHINMSDKKNLKKLSEAVANSVSNGKFEMNNVGLVMFYTTSFMSESVYYIKEENVFIVADIDKNNLLIHQIIADHKIDLDKLIKTFGSEIKHVTLGFTPFDITTYVKTELVEEDTTLFVFGKDFETFDEKKIMFPTLSHA